MNQDNHSKALQSSYSQTMIIDEDEISLIDLWIALLKFRMVFVISFVVVLVIGGIVVSTTLVPKYNLSSVISIGQLSIDQLSIGQLSIDQRGAKISIESPEAVINRASVLLVPTLTKMTAENNDMGIFTTNISNPKGTNLVTIVNKVTESSREAITQFQQQLLSDIIDAHDKLSEAGDQELRVKLGEAKLKLRELENPLELEKLTKDKVAELQLSKIELFKLSDSAYLSQKKASYLADIRLREESIQVHINQNRELKDLATVLGSNDESRYERSAIAVEGLENRKKINELRIEKTDLEQQLAVYELELEPKRNRQQALVKATQSEINLFGFNLKNQIEEQKHVVNGIENQLGGSKTQAIAVSELSLNPIGLGAITKYVVVVFLSLMAAFFITLVAMFRRKVNEKLAEEA